MLSIPNVDNLGNRLDISFESTNYHDGSNCDKVESLVDGSLTPKTKYGVLVTTNTRSHFKFTVKAECRIWAYGTYYSDSAGETPKKVSLFKDDVFVGEYQTKVNEWYVLFDNLEPGTYQLKVLVGNNNYNQFTEWYVEELEEKIFLIKDGDEYYSASKSNYADGEFGAVTIDEVKADNNLLVSAEYLTRDIVVDGERFKPILKFKNPQLVAFNNLDVSINGIKSDSELIIASNNFSTSIIDNIDFIDAVSTIDENCDIKMVVSNDYGKTWLTTNDHGFTWRELNINSINKPYGSLSIGEVGAWEKFKLGIMEHGFSMKGLNTINFNPIKDQVLRFAYVVQVQNKDQVCKVELLNIQFDTHGKIQKLKDDEVEISMDSFNAYVVPSRDMKLMKINMIG